MSVWNKLYKKVIKLLYQPIRVLCFHQVSEQYNPLTMWDCDWTQIDQFKRFVLQERASGVEFISIPEACKKLKNDWFRCQKYAVLTADDGYKSLLNILPWLEEQQIPITLFINTKYMDGRSWSEINEEQARRTKQDVDMLKDVCPKLYLTKEELKQVAALPNVTIGMHGHEHLDATMQTIDEFMENVVRCQEALTDTPHTIPYFAYTWGKRTGQTDVVLHEMGLIPVLINGELNYKNKDYLNRISIDGVK